MDCFAQIIQKFQPNLNIYIYIYVIMINQSSFSSLQNFKTRIIIWQVRTYKLKQTNYPYMCCDMIGIQLHCYEPINIELLGETYSVKCFDKLVTQFLHLTDDGAKPRNQSQVGLVQYIFVCCVCKSVDSNCIKPFCSKQKLSSLDPCGVLCIPRFFSTG